MTGDANSVVWEGRGNGVFAANVVIVESHFVPTEVKRPRGI